MICTDCNFETLNWMDMKFHYKRVHAEVKRLDKLFTKEARSH